MHIIRALSRRNRLRNDIISRLLWCCIVVPAALFARGATAAEFALAPGQQMVGETGHYVIRQGDIFPDLARRFDVGYTELVAANPGVDPWLPGVGRQITIPSLYVLPNAPHKGIVINLAEWRLFYYPPEGDRVVTYPLGLGVIGKKTPIGVTRIVRKEPNPAWYPPPSIRAERPDLPAVIPAGPDNPLGAFALRLGWPNYLIHGTNKPDGVGRNVSHGCIRLYPQDIEKLFASVAVGTPVRTVNQPVAAGWSGDALYLAVYPSKTQVDEIDTEKPVTPDPAQGARAAVRAAAGQYSGAVNWNLVDAAASERVGTPLRVADRGAYAGTPASPANGNAAADNNDRWPPYFRDPAPPPDSAYSTDDIAATPPDQRNEDQAYSDPETENPSDPAERVYNRTERLLDQDAQQ